MDLSFLEKFTQGNPQKKSRYISLYLESAPATFRDMEENLSASDWEQLRINAHSLKPQAEFMGLFDLKEKLIGIEESIRNQRYDQVRPMLSEAVSIHTTSENALREVLSDIGSSS